LNQAIKGPKSSLLPDLHCVSDSCFLGFLEHQQIRPGNTEEAPMTNAQNNDVEAEREPHGPALQIIILGTGGGPNEDNVTGLLVRSTATAWTKGSVLAVDAGVHLSSIVRIIDKHLPDATRHEQSEQTQELHSRFKQSIPRSPPPIPSPTPFWNKQSYFAPVSEVRANRTASPGPRTVAENGNGTSKLVFASGPFVDLMVPYETAKANAAYLLRNLISTYLITHPHLDHLSGFVVNTAALQQTSRPKKVAALPQTIDAIKTHIFNDVIWPNMSDEEGGIGFVSYQRLIEGGNVALGAGEGRGYIEVCDGLAVKAWSVSHGQCMKRHRKESHSHSGDGRRGSFAMISSPRADRRSSIGNIEHFALPSAEPCAVDSTAFFIRDEETGQEVLIFGDVEPDIVSLVPRNARVWSDAAPKIAAGLLMGIFIECSYDDSQIDSMLFGHLNPRHLVAELGVLAEKVASARRAAVTALEASKKRKRVEEEVSVRRGRPLSRLSNVYTGPAETVISPLTQNFPADLTVDGPTNGSTPSHDTRSSRQDHSVGSGPKMPPPPFQLERKTDEHDLKPLQGVQVVIIHVKDTLRDGEPAEDVILAQLLEHEKQAQLGCTFTISKIGESIWL
jgi:cAMP phosphodiesterase